LLEDVSIEGARGVLINITGGTDMTLWEVNEASSLVQEAAHEDANIIFGAVIDEKVGPGEIRVTVIATGLQDDRVRVGDDRERERDRGRERERGGDRERGSVAELRPLRREAPMAAPPPAAARETAPAPAAAQQQEKGEDFVSPFEDELDVPTFLRRRREEASSDTDREVPAFLRRSAD
jgi:cell division protein FtsZ